MSEHIIEVSGTLWIVVDVVAKEYDDGLFTIRDDTGGNVLVDKEELPALIRALQELQEREKSLAPPVESS